MLFHCSATYSRNEIGYAIGPTLSASFDPTVVQVASLSSGSQDRAVFIMDGTDSWYRCNWNQPPEGGPSWSPIGVIASGMDVMQSVETSPGVHRLLVGLPTGEILARNYIVFTDNSDTYAGFGTFGSLVLAQPGFLAEVQSITTELRAVGTQPAISILLDEISGTFEPLSTLKDDPPQLEPSVSVLSKRAYLSQSELPSVLRHMQIKLNFAAEDAKNELLTYSVFGAIVREQ